MAVAIPSSTGSLEIFSSSAGRSRKDPHACAFNDTICVSARHVRALFSEKYTGQCSVPSRTWHLLWRIRLLVQMRCPREIFERVSKERQLSFVCRKCEPKWRHKFSVLFLSRRQSDAARPAAFDNPPESHAPGPDPERQRPINSQGHIVLITVQHALLNKSDNVG